MTSPDRTELRIACVMNGGVSLAVWMAGVTHEIDLLRRATPGRTAAEADIPAYDQELWQRWRDAAGDRRIVVDIVAGTSAGGINGTLLAAAAAGGGRLDWPDEERRVPLLRRLWEDEAGLEKLLPEPEDSPPRSLLDGVHLASVIEDALGAVRRERNRHRDQSTLHPVTLFVTATALGESDDEYRDGFDQQFHVQDHRRRYRFRYDAEHVEFSAAGRAFEHRPLVEFDAYPEALARATRASSSFPVAFEPVSETEDMLGPPVRVQPEGRSATPAWLADGGILDNSPFGPVLEEIARRAPDADVERLLVYVVPSRGSRPGDVEPAAGRTSAPEWTAVLSSALRFPTESDFRDDIAEIRDLLFTANAQQQSVRLFCATAHGPGAPAAGTKLVESAALLLPTYWRGRVAGRIREARTLAEESGTRRAPRRLSAPDDVLHIDGELQQLAVEERGAPQPSFGPGEPVLDRAWEWGVGAGERCARLFARDVMDHLADGAPIREQAVGLAGVLRRISALSEALDATLKRLPAQELADTRTARRLVDETAASLGVPAVMWGLMNEAAGHYADAIAKLGSSASDHDVTRVALAVEVCDRALRAGSPYARVPRFTFLRLGPDVDAPVLAGVAGDGALGAHLGDRKLYGTGAGHFAAFARAEWRSHDWLWGRLDAIAHLGRALLRHRSRQEIEEWIRETQALVLTSEGVTAKQLWQTTEHLLKPVDPGWLETIDPAVVTQIEQRAARMIADQFDIKLVPERAERFLVTQLLDKLIDRLGIADDRNARR
jgi:predicted acylesterase/phospholipase RssA